MKRRIRKPRRAFVLTLLVLVLGIVGHYLLPQLGFPSYTLRVFVAVYAVFVLITMAWGNVWATLI